MLISDLSIIVRGSYIFSSRKLVDYEITAAEEFILMYILGHEQSNQDAIAKYFMIDKGSVARSLAKLESKGFISRTINDENQREKVIRLTPKAHKIKDVMTELLIEWTETIYDGLTKEEISNFETTAKKVAANITKAI